VSISNRIVSISKRREVVSLVLQLSLCQELLECYRNQCTDLAKCIQSNKVHKKRVELDICYGYHYSYVLGDLD
jgi:hypothetical protein